MTIPIGEKIKKLRAQNYVTQEVLAKRLGVTPQAISRWESQTGYPDIEILPAIAEFFGVTTDELLGIDRSAREQRLAEIYEKIDVLSELGTGAEAIPEARKWAAEFPSDDRIQKHLADTLCRAHMWEEPPDKDALDEAEALYRMLIDGNSPLREETIEALAALYDIGYKDTDRALETAGMLPSMKYCRESVLANLLRVGPEYAQDYIERLTDALGLQLSAYICYSVPNGSERWDEKIAMLEQVIGLYALVFGENQLFYHERTAMLHRYIATYTVAQGKREETLSRLEKMCAHLEAEARAAAGDVYTSAIMEGMILPEHSEDFHTNLVHNAAWYTLHNKLTQGRWNSVREDPRFAAVEARLTAVAK